MEESEVATTNVELLLEEDPGIAGLYLPVHAFWRWELNLKDIPFFFKLGNRIRCFLPTFNTNCELDTCVGILILTVLLLLLLTLLGYVILFAACSGLFGAFLQSLKNNPAEHQVFQLMEEFESQCADQVALLKKLTKRTISGQSK